MCHQFQINDTKSGILIHRVNRRSKTPDYKSILGIPIVKEYRYLGIVIDDRLFLDAEVEEKKKIEQNPKKAHRLL